jgi:prepilin-type N-terminal cleavage/methylation domain-containing protein
MCRSSCTPPSHSRGFTLLELSVSLAIIFIVLSAVTIGRDVHRNAAYQRISSDFVQGWLLAYDSFTTATGNVPGDTVATPTGRVSGKTKTPLCGSDLLGAMQAAGINMPEGRAEGSADRYVYLDSNGLPHEIQVCFSNENWLEPDAEPGKYLVRSRNVMRLTGITPALANLLDGQIDNHPDARFGRMRESSKAGDKEATSSNWSLDEGVAIGSITQTNQDESQVVELTAYIKMNR